jgi:UPF0716 protein FxsA
MALMHTSYASDGRILGDVLPILFLMLLAIPVAELYVILQVSQQVGVLETIALLVLISAVGAWLLKQQGLATWARLQRTLAEGRVPGKELTDGALILFGGALLLTPGFLTDIVGIVLLFPVTRAAVKRAARPLLARWAHRKSPAFRIYETTATRTSRPSPREHPSRHPALRDGEDDSPDRG